MEKPPVVFISYSHDSPEHKRWVDDFASRLVQNGVDVFLDQWELGLGDDVPKFMSSSINAADRVLMICTEHYVNKANEGKGGVGYEAMIVTAELIQDLGTSKFIPVIRQNSGSNELPNFIGARYYCNLNEDQNYEEQFEDLLRELHKAPKTSKPPLGKNPFAKTPSGGETPISIVESTIPDISELSNPSEVYDTALEIARQGDVVSWRKIIREAKKPINNKLIKWRAKYDSSPPENNEELLQAAYKGITNYDSLFSIAMAGVESGRENLKNQVSILDDILNPREWNRAGLNSLAHLPDAVAYTYQALHGALCLHTHQISLAIKLAKHKVYSPYNAEAVPLYQNPYIIGWPDTLTGHYSKAWNFLIDLPNRWEWLNGLFGEAYEFYTSLCSYYIALNVLECADIVANGNEEVVLKGQSRLQVPLTWMLMKIDIKKHAYRLLLSDPNQVSNIWMDLGVNTSKIEKFWPDWIELMNHYIVKENIHLLERDVVHKNLFTDLK